MNNKKILWFGAEWCGPCRMLAPVMADLSDEINYEKIDIDTDVDRASEYGLRSVPTLILVDENNKEIGRKTGQLSKEEILNFYTET